MNVTTTAAGAYTNPSADVIYTQNPPSVTTGFYISTIVSTTQNVTNSSTLTNSTDLQAALNVGTWDIECMEFVGSTLPAVSGSKSMLAFSGTCAFVGQALRALSTSATPVGVAPVAGSFPEALDTLYDAAGNSLLVSRVGRVVVTVAGTLSVKFAQSVQTPSQSAQLLVGSYLRVTKVN